MPLQCRISRIGLAELGCSDVVPDVVQSLDSIDGVSDLIKVGEKVAELKVKAAHFDSRRVEAEGDPRAHAPRQ